MSVRGVVCVWFLIIGTGGGFAGEYGRADIRDEKTQIPEEVTPVMDDWMRDTWVTPGPDGYYYLTGTTAAPGREFAGQPHCWDWNDGIYLWRSEDMKTWETLGPVWTFDKDATWQKEAWTDKRRNPGPSVNGDPLDNKFRAVWAPELHYIRSRKNWFIVACMNRSAKGAGSFILESTTGRPEGPYANIEGNRTEPLFPYIDGSLFEDTDGTVYFLCLDKYIARMKDDMSGLAEEVRELQQTPYDFEPYIEGVSLFKHDGKYHLVQAIWSHVLPDGTETYATANDTETCFSYDCVIAVSDRVYGPYRKRYTAITGGGHTCFFRSGDGKWWATLFFNPRGRQALEFGQTCRPALIPMKYEDFKFRPEPERTE